MAIANFPLALQGIIQQNMLEREFKDGLTPNLVFRSVADRETFATNVGETVRKTRKSLKAPVTTPMNPASNTNLDNGLTPSGWDVEQYDLTIYMYGDTIDLNMVTQKVGIADQFLANAKTNGQQAAASVDTLARNALFSTYTGGNTVVTQSLGAPSNVIDVDNVTGFTWANQNGVQVPVSGSNPLTVTIGSDVYNVVGYAIDAVNVSNSPFGKSGTLTLATNVSVSDGAAGMAVQSAVSPIVVRPAARQTTGAIVPTDTLTMAEVQAAVTELRSNSVPTINGTSYYHCYLTARQMQGLFKDPAFQLLYRGQYDSSTYETGFVASMLGVKFIVSSTIPTQRLPSGLPVYRAIVCGQGAIVEGVFAGTGVEEMATRDAGEVSVIDGIAQVIREPLDRLKHIVGQSWYYVGGFAVPTDMTANSLIIPTASNSAFKRAVIIESA